MPGRPHHAQWYNRLRAVAAGACVAGSVGLAAGQPQVADDVTDVLRRVGERVQQYFARAQSLVCLETVYLQPLGMGLSPSGPGRNVESELRMSWEPLVVPAVPEARMLRQVLKVNGGPPRRKDPNNCTVPEQFESEEPVLAMLLPGQQHQYTFKLAGRGRVDRRDAIIVEFRELARVAVDVQLVENNEDCVNFDMKGGLRGRIWIDPETFEVLRLDQGLIGLVDIQLPRKLTLRSGGVYSWTMERWDTSIRFESMSFRDPDETLTLPVSILSLRITRGSASPRLRTTTEFTQYRRFLTGGRVVPP
jgi:hypothetical protein